MLAKLEDEYGLKIVRVDVEDRNNNAIVQENRIQSLPTLVITKDGRKTSVVGNMGIDRIRKIINGM